MKGIGETLDNLIRCCFIERIVFQHENLEANTVRKALEAPGNESKTLQDSPAFSAELDVVSDQSQRLESCLHVRGPGIEYRRRYPRELPSEEPGDTTRQLPSFIYTPMTRQQAQLSDEEGVRLSG